VGRREIVGRGRAWNQDMITRQRLATYGIPTLATATIITAALLHKKSETRTYVHEPEATYVQPVGDHQIDVVFAVDTTGSMGGLIDGAKRTVWSIASHIRKTDPDADLRIGLVAYKDVGDEYVTKPFWLTNDLDGVYGELASYTASGGNDTPEDVDAALDVAVHKMGWRDGAKKMVFVVGDAPPASRGEVPNYAVSARDAAAAGIIINTIRCGFDGKTQLAFTRLAEIGNGEFSTIQQDGGVQQVATPFDDQLAEISAQIDDTVMVMGGEEGRMRYREKMAITAKAAPAAKADRASYYAKGGMARGGDDLVGGVATGSMTIDAIPEAAMPADLKGKDKDEIKAEVEAKIAKRKVLQAKMADVAKQRDEYLSTHGTDGEGGFDAKVKNTVERQLKK
jgi:hypothetical protein